MGLTQCFLSKFGSLDLKKFLSTPVSKVSTNLFAGLNTWPDPFAFIIPSLRSLIANMPSPSSPAFLSVAFHTLRYNFTVVGKCIGAKNLILKLNF